MVQSNRTAASPSRGIFLIVDMYDWTNFDVVFEKASKWTYEQSTVQTILRSRQNMEGVLFFDRIWESLGLRQGEMLEPQ